MTFTLTYESIQTETMLNELIKQKLHAKLCETEARTN